MKVIHSYRLVFIVLTLLGFVFTGCFSVDSNAPTATAGGDDESSSEVTESSTPEESSSEATSVAADESSSEKTVDESSSSEVDELSSVIDESSSSEEVTESSSSEMVSSSTPDESSSETEVPQHEGFTFEFEDKFDSFDEETWLISDGGWGGNDANFEENGVEIEDGQLALVMRKDYPEAKLAWGQRLESSPAGEGLQARDYSSGEIRSHRQYLYGRFETDIEISENAEFYISTFFLYRIPRDIEWLEIDIELISSHKDKPTTNMLVDWTGAYDWNELTTTDGFDEFVRLPSPTKPHKESHRYAIEWTPERVAWYIDGDLIREFTQKNWIPNKPCHIMFNFWILEGLTGKYPSSYLEDGTEAKTYYDNFRYYKWNGEDDFEHEAWCGSKTWNDNKCE